MTVVNNRRVVVVSRPTKGPEEANFKLITHNQVDVSSDSSLKDGEILVQTKWLSLDPYLLLSMGRPDEPRASPYPDALQFKDGAAVVAFGAPYGGRGAGVVLQSKNNKVKVGDYVAADWKWEEYPIFNPDTEVTFEVLEKDIFNEDNLSTALGLYSVSGSHAYYGYSSLNLKAGDTLVVSTAAGNIGIIAAQLGKAHGVKTIGLTGSDEKVAALVKGGFVDHAINYAATGGNVDALAQKIRELAPNGVTGYYDNTRGWISEAVWKTLIKGARVYVGGAVSQYGEAGFVGIYDVSSTSDVSVTTGMQNSSKYLTTIPEVRKILHKLVVEGKLKPVEHITVGFENTAKGFVEMYKGVNFGKAVVKV